MIGIEEAIKIAKEHNNKYNAFQEYADAYEFFINDGEIRYGGGDNSIFVLKRDGKILRFADYAMGNRNAVEIGRVKEID